MRKFLFAAGLLLLTSCPSSLAEALREYGYMPVRPASAMWEPGASIYVRSRDPFQVGFICTAKQMLGDDFEPLESLTSNAELARASKKGITMAAHVQDVVNADSELQNIKSLKMTLKNVRVFELSDFQVERGRRYTDRRCLRAIKRRRAQGFDVTLISGAIKADIVYSVNFDKSSKLDVDAKVAAVQNLSAKLGVDASATSATSINADGLIWGIRDDAFLAYLIDQDDLPRVDRGSSIISSETQSQLEVMLEASNTLQLSPDSQQELPAELPVAQDPGQELPAPRAYPTRNPNRHSTVY